MENIKYSREYQLHHIEVVNRGTPVYESSGKMNPEIMKEILKNIDEEGNYSFDNPKIKGSVESIIFTQKYGEDEPIEMGSHEFVEMGRPLQFKRTIEDTVIEKL